MIWTLAFWKGAGERAIKTFLQVAVSLISVGGIGSTVGLFDIDWFAAASVAVVAAILSFATSVMNADFVAGDRTPLHSTEYSALDHTHPGGGVRLDGL